MYFNLNQIIISNSVIYSELGNRKDKCNINNIVKLENCGGLYFKKPILTYSKLNLHDNNKKVIKLLINNLVKVKQE